MAQKLKNKAVSNPIFGPSLLQRRQNEQCKLLLNSSQSNLNFADVARHNAGKDTRLPEPRRPEGHNRSGRHSMTRHSSEAEHDTRSLSGPQRSLKLFVADGWRALHMKPPSTLDELEWSIDLVPQPLHDGNAPNPAKEAVVIFDSHGSASRP